MIKPIRAIFRGFWPLYRTRFVVQALESRDAKSTIPMGRAVVRLVRSTKIGVCSITLGHADWDVIERGDALRLRGSREQLSSGERCWLWWSFEGGARGTIECEAHLDEGTIVRIHRGPFVSVSSKPSRGR